MLEILDSTDILEDSIIDYESIEELNSSGDDNCLVIKDATLMSEGTWNNYFYPWAEINNAITNTNWVADENRFIFWDHKDGSAANWIGHVQNVRSLASSKTAIGDLYIYDPSAINKLKYGKPKLGVSPKIKGKVNDKSRSVGRFTFENFSLVINPAVKTAYLKNMEDEDLAEISAFEQKRKSMGLTPSQFYAVPKEPPSASKLPIFDAAHVRNAMARFNQVKGISSSERATARRKIVNAAKKFGINVGKFDKGGKSMAEEENEEETETKDSISLKDVESIIEKKLSEFLKKIKANEEEETEEKEEKEVKEQLSELIGILKKKELAEEEAKKEEEKKKTDEGEKEGASEVKEEEVKSKTTEEKLSEDPERITSKGEYSTGKTEELFDLAEIEVMAEDKAFSKFLSEGGIGV